MNIIRFILPFLFARNWYDGSWEFSRARFALFIAVVLFIALGLGLVYVLHMPVVYVSQT